MVNVIEVTELVKSTNVIEYLPNYRVNAKLDLLLGYCSYTCLRAKTKACLVVNR